MSRDGLLNHYRPDLQPLEPSVAVVVERDEVLVPTLLAEVTRLRCLYLCHCGVSGERRTLVQVVLGGLFSVLVVELGVAGLLLGSRRVGLLSVQAS